MAPGCALFQSPDPNDEPKYAKSDDDIANGTDPKDQKPLLSTDTFREENIRRNFKQLVGQGPDREIARDLYTKAQAAYEEARNLTGQARSEKFTAAAELYTAAADRWPKTQLEQDALFMAAESYFFADAYVEANRKYEGLIKKFPNTRHMDVVEARRFLIAKYWIVSNDKDPQQIYEINFTDPERPWADIRGNALRVLEKIRTDDPTGKLADDATLAAAMEHFSKNEWEKSCVYYEDLIKAYPASEHQFNAHFYGLKAKLNSYRGAAYAGDSLDAGEKLVKQMRRQFPEESAQEREFLDRSYAEIRYKKAERNWKMAEYYDSRGEYGGAKFYYDVILREYDDTPFAARADQRQKQIADKPNIPPQYLSWLVSLFPESDELKPILQKAMVKPGEELPAAEVDVTANEN